MVPKDRDSFVASLKLGRALPHGTMPDLYEDVMEAICGSVDDIHDLLTVSLTCSVMWRIAIRQLLRTHTIHLKSGKTIRGFREFILNQKPTRAQHIRSLVIPKSAWTPDETLVHVGDAGDQLMDILDCAINLDTLSLFLHEFYRAGPARISSAFARMRALRHLSLSDPYLIWAHTLSALRPPPVTLCLRTTTCLTLPLHNALLKLAASLDRFQSTSSVLTSLHLDWIRLDDVFLGLPQFRSVRSLIITEVRGEPKLDALLYLFPRLDGTFRLHLTLREITRLSSSKHRLALIREENRRAQEASLWEKLDRLDCEATTAFALALQCPVRHLTVDFFDTGLLADIRMQHLVVTYIPFPHGLAPFEDRTHASSLASSPTHVVLIIVYEAEDYRDEDGPADFTPRRNGNAVFESAVRALSFFAHVTHVRLVFFCYKAYPLRDELDEYDLVHQMRECASIPPSPRLLAACPSLRCFIVTAAGRDESQASAASHDSWLQTGAWRIVEAEDRRGTADGMTLSPAPRWIEELGGYATRRVIEAEDLGLPEEWERKLAGMQDMR
ncbi:hypothetical protein V8D89_009905 [Ganoderma adspersum]